MEQVLVFIATALAFLLFDALWLGLVAKSFYLTRLKSLISEKPRFGVAALFYVIYVIGIVIFAVEPARAADSWTTAAINGSLLGLIAYSTYDLTNLATLKNWPVSVAIVDVVWGALLTSMSATVGFAISLYLV